MTMLNAGAQVAEEWIEEAEAAEETRILDGPREDLDGLPDTELMLRVKHGDDGAFERLYRKYQLPLFGFTLRSVGDPSRAEELVQEAFLQIYRARKRYEPRARFSTYLYRVMTNLCLNERRRVAHSPRLEAPPVRDGKVEPIDSPDLDAATMEEWVDSSSRLAALKERLNGLSSNQRTAILLSRVHGRSCREIARLLGVSVPAVKSLVFRATRRLRGVEEGELALASDQA